MSDAISPEPKMQKLLLGRTRERAVIDTLLHDALHGTSAALVISGPAGIGKSALLRYAVDIASDFRVLHVSGVEPEMAFGFAGVHQLVLPLAGAVAASTEIQL